VRGAGEAVGGRGGGGRGSAAVAAEGGKMRGRAGRDGGPRPVCQQESREARRAPLRFGACTRFQRARPSRPTRAGRRAQRPRCAAKSCRLPAPAAWHRSCAKNTWQAPPAPGGLGLRSVVPQEGRAHAPPGASARYARSAMAFFGTSRGFSGGEMPRRLYRGASGAAAAWPDPRVTVPRTFPELQCPEPSPNLRPLVPPFFHADFTLRSRSLLPHRLASTAGTSGSARVRSR
jgi:hypothetical protein